MMYRIDTYGLGIMSAATAPIRHANDAVASSATHSDKPQ